MEELQQVEEPDPPLPAKQVVFVDNMSEDVWWFIAAMNNVRARTAEIKENSALTDRQYLSLAAEYPLGLMYVSPEKIDPVFIDYVSSLMGGVQPEVLTPKQHLGRLSEDILADQELFNKIARMKQIKLISYCSSKPWYKLINRLNQTKCEVLTPESPEEKYWSNTVGIYGTKTGLRGALEQQDGVLGGKMSKGAIVTGKEMIAAKALEMVAEGCRGVVVKIKKGHAGMGVVIIEPEQVEANKLKLHDYVMERLEESNGYWNKFPSVVEEFIQTNQRIGGGFPNIECQVDQWGKVNILYTCGMRVKNGVFAGVEIVKDALPDNYHDQVCLIGKALGQLYADQGYRGFFDVDFLADISGNLLISESNVRRTGGTWAIQTVKRLFGDNYLEGDRYLATNLMAMPKLAGRSFEEVIQKLEPILINKQTGRDTGIVMASANLVSQNKLNYMVVAANKLEADKLEEKLVGLLE